MHLHLKLETRMYSPDLPRQEQPKVAEEITRIMTLIDSRAEAKEAAAHAAQQRIVRFVSFPSSLHSCARVSLLLVFVPLSFCPQCVPRPWFACCDLPTFHAVC